MTLAKDPCPPLEESIIDAYTNLDSVAAVAFLSVVISAWCVPSIATPTLVEFLPSAYGVTCCQTFYYYRSERAKKDTWPLKSMVRLRFSGESACLTILSGGDTHVGSSGRQRIRFVTYKP